MFTLFPRLAERRTQKAGTMSGGEQQMCAIGRALMARPKLLMLDEPSMGLAPIFVERIFETIVEINKQGTPILLVEQNALMALDVADRGYVLETGTVALDGPAGDLARERAGPQDLPRRGVGEGGSQGSRFPKLGKPAVSPVHAEREVRRREQEADPRCAARATLRHVERAPTPCVGTKPSWRAAVASRQPATSTAPSRSSCGRAGVPVGEGEERVARAAGAVRVDRPRVARRRPLGLGDRLPDRVPSGSPGRTRGTAAASDG